MQASSAAPLPSRPRYCGIVTPWAGRGRGREAIPQIRALLEGLDYDLVLTEAPGQATTLAAAATDEGVEVMVAAGGDGTTFEAINGLAGRETALAALPPGSGNDFQAAGGTRRSGRGRSTSAPEAMPAG